MADERYRNWATIVYLESAPSGWMDIYSDLHVEGLASPLHDRDVNPETGEVKKPHWHVTLQVPGKISEDAARSIFEKIGGVGCERVRDLRVYARYLIHADEPEGSGKARYRACDVRTFGGVDYYELTSGASDRLDLICEMQQWCEDTGTVSFAALSRYAKRERRDWMRILATTQGVNVMTAYLKSMCWERSVGIGSESDSL